MSLAGGCGVRGAMAMTISWSGASRVRLPLVIAAVLLGQHLAANEVKLEPGAQLPTLDGTTLNGDPAALPRDARGHPVVIVIGFSKASTKMTRPWLDNCRTAASSRPAGSAVSCYDVRMLENVPRSFRGMVERSMRSGYPVELERWTLLVYSGNDAWRGRVGAVDDKAAYVIGCDKDGHVRRTATGPFVNGELQKLLEAIDPIPPSSE